MNFGLYFNLGWEHITDPTGYDHILFIIAMCAVYRISDFKKVAIMVTAFTVGHSISLALAILNIIPVWTELIEFLIPVTILITCFRNIAFPSKTEIALAQQIDKTDYWRYFWILSFGLIHGLGFSNFLRATLVADESIFSPLLAFNIGLEIGQLLIVFFVFVVGFVFLNILQKLRRVWNVFISGIVAGPAAILALERIGALFNSN